MIRLRKTLLTVTILMMSLLLAVPTLAKETLKAPKFQTARQSKESQVTVSWGKVSKAKGYSLEYRISGKKWTVKNTKKTKITVNKLKTGKTYQFRVRAYQKKKGSKKYSKYSSIRSVKLRKTGSVQSVTTKGYTIKNENTTAYKNSSLKDKLGTIFGSDELVIHEVTGSYAKVTYPVSRGTKTGYIPTSKILTKVSGTYYTAKAKITTYRRPNGSSYGYIAKDDSVEVLGTNGSYTQVKYPVSGGYKYAFITSSDCDKYITGIDSTSENDDSVRDRLDDIMEGSLTYNRNTVMALGRKFTGYRSNEQCKGYAKNVFYLCFKIQPGSTQKKPNNYKLYATSGMKLVDSDGDLTSTDAKRLFSDARTGDFVQIRRRHSGPHSAIVYETSSSGVTFVEANLDGKNTIYKKTYSWSDLSKKNEGMSVYTATDYRLK